MSSNGGDEKLLAALDIMQRMPPNKIEQSLTALLNLIPEDTDELLQVSVVEDPTHSTTHTDVISVDLFFFL